MILTIREEPIKMDFNTFKARVVVLVNELEKLGNRATTMYCGPDSEYDSMARQNKQFWRAKIDINGSIGDSDLRALQEKIMHNESIQARQGIIRRKLP
jgi:hypothetical protein